jgi:hypothetical protein
VAGSAQNRGAQEGMRLTHAPVTESRACRLVDKCIERKDFDVGGFVAKMEEHRPLVIAFNGRLAAKVVARYLDKSVPVAGADWQLAGAQVYRLPSSSGAAAIGTDMKRQAWQAFGAWLRMSMVAR